LRISNITENSVICRELSDLKEISMNEAAPDYLTIYKTLPKVGEKKIPTEGKAKAVRSLNFYGLTVICLT
jgi:hypothetical protein